MADLLAFMFAHYDDADALTMLRDTERRAAIASDARSHGHNLPEDLIGSTEWQNLLVALVTLRVKFPRDVALQKVELNIAMREGRA
jgi:hypothetical protein